MRETTEEPAIIRFGRSYIKEDQSGEYLASFVRAFKDGRADFVVLDSNVSGQRFLAACMAWAIDKGLLYNDRNSDDGQQVVSSFRLTKRGRIEILGES